VTVAQRALVRRYWTRADTVRCGGKADVMLKLTICAARREIERKKGARR